MGKYLQVGNYPNRKNHVRRSDRVGQVDVWKFFRSEPTDWKETYLVISCMEILRSEHLLSAHEDHKFSDWESWKEKKRTAAGRNTLYVPTNFDLVGFSVF